MAVYRVLIVDDNADAAESLSELLSLWGHKTQTAQNGPEALSLMTQFHPDIVFLDRGLPGMSGYEVARAIRSDVVWVSTILVALTGWVADDDRRRSAEAGVDFHMVKPIEIDQLEGPFDKLLPECNTPRKLARNFRRETSTSDSEERLEFPVLL
jgi:CheY-like chemotaxis protein